MSDHCYHYSVVVVVVSAVAVAVTDVQHVGRTHEVSLPSVVVPSCRALT